MIRDTLIPDDRGRVQYVDLVLTFANLVAFAAMAPIIYAGIGMATGTVDPFSSVLLQLALPLFVVAMIISVGISARTR